MSRWPSVELGEVLHTQIDAVESAELETVNLAGVYGFARGLFKREPISPLDTTYKRFHRLNAGDFVISSPKAWEGAIARIPEEFDGWFLSPVFPTFRANPDRLNTRYLDWYCKREAVWAQLQGKAKGMGARRESVSPAQFLSLNIPLPTIDEQQCIVARLDQLADKVRQVKEHLDAAENDAFRLLISMATRRDLSDEQRKSMGWKETAIGDFAKLALSPVTVDANENYPNIGIYSFAKGLFEKPPIEGSRTSAKTLYKIRNGQFIYSRLFAFEGGYALVPPEFDGYFVSNEFPTFDIDLEKATTKFLITLFLTEQDWQELAMSSKGVGDRRLRIQPEKILHRKIWLPPLKEQKRIEKMFDAYQALKDKHAAIREANQALIPATLERVFQ
ncbi:restriction endonuclease subunit S [Methylomonas sp. MgM2]